MSNEANQNEERGCDCGLPFCTTMGPEAIAQFLTEFRPRVILDKVDDSACYVHHQDLYTALIAVVNLNVAANQQMGNRGPHVDMAHAAMAALAHNTMAALMRPDNWAVVNGESLPDTVPTDWLNES